MWGWGRRMPIAFVLINAEIGSEGDVLKGTGLRMVVVQTSIGHTDP